MDYEKLHRNTITKLQEMVNSGKITVETAYSICADFVPETEDERIRKELIGFVKSRGGFKQEYIVWLEKQGEKHIDKELSKLLNRVICLFINNPLIPYSERDEVSKKIIPYVEQLEKQCEQKPADKVESGQEELTEFEKAVKQVMEEAIECGDTHNLKADAEMLLRLVQKSTWSEEDIELLDNTIKFIEDRVAATSPSLRTYIPTLTGKEIPFLKALKDRVQPKQEWSEEDKQAIEDAETWLDTLCDYLKDSSSEFIPTVKNVISKLKSLKDRCIWKPSDEQMEYLAKAIITLGNEGDCKTASMLNYLRFDLKKLMEE